MTRQEALLKFREHLNECLHLEPLISTDHFETGDSTWKMEMYLQILLDMVK